MQGRECTRSREWLSAYRDSEALDDAQARAHLDACDDCGGWVDALDGLTRAVRVRAAGSPDVASAGIEAFRRHVVEPVERQREVARMLLGVAGVAGLALFAIAIAGVSGTTAVAGHFGRDLSGLQAAISVGFLLAAWRPGSYGRGLLPVTAAAVLVVLLPSAAHAATLEAAPLAEAAHLPLLLGLVGLLLLVDPARQSRGLPA
jgi:predicted anti-sigma-YlaC factor YlaD